MSKIDYILILKKYLVQYILYTCIQYVIINRIINEIIAPFYFRPGSTRYPKKLAKCKTISKLLCFSFLLFYLFFAIFTGNGHCW